MKELLSMKTMCFYIAGGWGYKNLGDYAILIALLKRIEKLNVHAEIIVSSFNVEETRKVLTNFNVSVIPSFHQLLWGDQPYRELHVIGKTAVVRKPDSGLLVKVLDRVQSKLVGYYGAWLNRKNASFLENLDGVPSQDELKKSDCFILAGGGYFNDWQSCFLSHILELACAKKNGLPVVALGPTMGPFSESQYPLVKGFLDSAKAIVVRDEQSISELGKLGLEATIISDLALSDIPDNEWQKDPTLILVPGDVPQDARAPLLSAVTQFCRTHDLSIRVVVTRLYALDVYFAERMKRVLTESGIRVELSITDDYCQVLPQLMKGRLIVSWNLHGLILAWRAGVPGVCLNDGRKFVSFMKQTDQDDLLVSWRTLSHSGVLSAMERALTRGPIPLSSRREFAKKITQTIDDTLAMLNPRDSK